MHHAVCTESAWSTFGFSCFCAHSSAALRAGRGGEPKQVTAVVLSTSPSLADPSPGRNHQLWSSTAPNSDPNEQHWPTKTLKTAEVLFVSQYVISTPTGDSRENCERNKADWNDKWLKLDQMTKWPVQQREKPVLVRNESQSRVWTLTPYMSVVRIRNHVKAERSILK